MDITEDEIKEYRAMKALGMGAVKCDFCPAFINSRDVTYCSWCRVVACWKCRPNIKVYSKKEEMYASMSSPQSCDNCFTSICEEKGLDPAAYKAFPLIP